MKDSRPYLLTGCAAVALNIAVSTGLSSCAVSSSQPDLAVEGCPAKESILSATESPYGRSLIAAIQKEAFFPPAAQSAGQGGHVEICVNVNRDGAIKRAMVADSSRFPLLDGAALYTAGLVKANNYMAALPSKIAGSPGGVWFSVPVDFQYTDGKVRSPLYSAEDAEQNWTDDQSAAVHRYFSSPAFKDLGKKFDEAFSKSLIYPPPAQQASEEGSAKVDVLLRRDGQILGAAITRSSHDPVFDGMTLMAIGLVALRSEKFPLPDDLPITSIWMDMPVNFEMGG